MPKTLEKIRTVYNDGDRATAFRDLLDYLIEQRDAEAAKSRPALAGDLLEFIRAADALLAELDKPEAQT